MCLDAEGSTMWRVVVWCADPMRDEVDVSVSNRREVLIGISSACAGCVLTGCALGGGGGGVVDAGGASDFAVGDLAAVAGEGVAVGRDTDGYYALSTICTHQGCDMASQGRI